MKIFFVFVMILSVLVFDCFPVFADTPDLPFTEFIVVDGQKVKLKDGLDLSGKDLHGIEIHRCCKELWNVNFDGCNLDGADFSETFFVRCSFRKVVFKGLSFDGYNENCDFTDVWLGEGTGLILNRKQLESTQNFKKRRISGLHIGGDLCGTDFSGCELSNTYFERCRMKDCNFTNAKIEGCRFMFVIWFFLDFSDKNKIPSDMDAYHKESGDFDFNIEQLLVTKDFREGEVVNVSFNRVNWPDRVVDLSNMVFMNCNLGWSDTSAKIDLTDSVISKCNFEYFHGLTLENVKSTWNYKHNRMEGIKLPEEIQKALDAEKKKQ